MRDKFIKELCVLAAADARIMLVTGDLGFGVLETFERQFPKQYLNAGVAEQNMTGLATGLALEGRVVFTYSIANFPVLRCLEQLRNDAAYHGANVNVVSVGGGFGYGALGFSHHATEDLAVMRSMPATTILAPGCDWEAVEATRALVSKKGVGYLRLDKSTAGDTQGPGERFILGKMRVLREGSDFTLVSTGGILVEALAAAKTLSSDGIACRVVSVPCLKPFDVETILAACTDTGGILSIEEHSVIGGLGSAIAEACLEAGTPPLAFYRMGLRNEFTTVVGSQEYLRKRYQMDAAAIVTKVRELVKMKSRPALQSVLRK